MKEAAPIASDRRARIVSAARKEFMLRGFRATDLGVFAQELGMSKKTVYQEFKNKEALVEAVIRDKVADVRTVLHSLMQELGISSPEEIQRFILCVQAQLKEIHAPFLKDLNKIYPELFNVVVNARREIVPQYFGKLIAQGQKNGTIRSDIPKTVIVEIMLSIADSILIPEKYETLRLTPKNAFGLVLSVIMDGILTGKRANA